jgi:hypothetical protein
MYGSSLTKVTFRPRASRMAASDADAIPLPNDETTPPVINTKLDIDKFWDSSEIRGVRVAPLSWNDSLSFRPIRDNQQEQAFAELKQFGRATVLKDKPL